MSVEIVSFRWGDKGFKRPLGQFLRLPRRYYRDDPRWAPESPMERHDFHNPAKHLIRRTMDITYFLALKDGEPVGRITAHSYPAHNATFHDKVGFFGFFEADDDPEVAAALFDAAAARLREMGFDTMRGPMSFCTNEEFGTLMWSHEPVPPAVMTTHTADWHPTLYEGAGFAKAQDVVAYDVGRDQWPNPKIQRLSKIVKERIGATLRQARIDKKGWAEEIKIVNDLYRRAWEQNWGFVPLTDDEFEEFATELRPFLLPELTLIAEVKGEPVGWSLTLPDLHQVFIHAKGSILRFAWHVLVRKKHRKLPGIVTRGRITALGVVPEYRRRGLEAMFYEANFETLLGWGVDNSEMSWILDDNAAMNNGALMMGGHLTKRWRVWDRSL